ncbi:sigma 54-interacting transcriptional regulator [Acetivibrio ethanolgignens]|uniref:Transcriptional regulator n=1 Tax=Acetivibrio ethanolgignens TaxID=290052 RepID=A0A0V8QAJ8_9FIRM|nr:sigma 54-interacting transcriptional regulator [Acetivibrio ethanolgignens]KSV57586.1 transcriptional regulator [Acetivibrio ethanolgignens]
MVKIRMFIPYMNMKERFEEVISRVPRPEDVEVEMVHVFGTPESLDQYGDAEIMVARGMTYDKLKGLFPEKHMVEIQLTSFDILEALVEAKNKFAPKKIALCIRYMDEAAIKAMEQLTGAEITYYEIQDEASTQEAIYQAKKNGTDVYVGAGTMCGLCDKEGLNRVHIHTKDGAIEIALSAAIDAARTINMERTRAKITRTILNTSKDAVIAINEKGRIMAANNQTYRLFQIPSQEVLEGQPAEKVCPDFCWQEAISGNSRTELLKIGGKQCFVDFKPLVADKMDRGTIITISSTEQIIEAETKIRRSLSEKGLTAKYSFEDIIGSSDAIKDNIMMAKRYSRVDSNVLIVGETGTGKELFAHSIHRASRRSAEPFVALNCAALPENLLESELFGYEAGAFSGASKGGKIGLFELAHKGTIFLDEIGEIPITLQAKLLRVLQEKEIRRIGSDRVQPIDVRVISATNINIEEQIKEGKFRADLYYRLNLLDIVIPPLRERKGDIREMVDFYLTRFACEMGKPIPRLSQKAVQLLSEYDWPGNVRELRNICERLTVLNDMDEIDEAEIRQLKIFRQSRPEDCKQDNLQELYGQVGPKKKKQDIAKELGVSRTTLWRMTKKKEENK